MNHMLPTICAALMLTACSQEFTRYDRQPGAAPSLFRPAMGAGDAFETGFAAIRAGDYAAAEAPLTRHLRSAPDDAYALLAMGAVMERTGRTDEAVTYYRSAAFHGDAATPAETVSLDGKAGPGTGTVRDLALFNISRLR